MLGVHHSVQSSYQLLLPDYLTILIWTRRYR